MKKKPIKLIKFIDWGFMQFTTLLIIGYTKEEALKKMDKKLGYWKKLVSDLSDDCQGQHLNHQGSSVIRLKSFDIDLWLDWEMLLHETNHNVNKNVTENYPDNSELIAYAHENLFRLCRKEIFKKVS